MSGIVSKEILERIRQASDIVEVIQGYVPLKRAGANFKALCPFHQERSPSFHVNPQRQSYHCFGCHKGGDVFRFLQDYENLSFMDSVRRLAERARIPLEFENSAGHSAERELREQLLRIHSEVAAYWHQQLKSHPEGRIARDYLASRQFDGRAIQGFELGYAPRDGRDLFEWARRKNIRENLLEQAGLTVQPEQGRSYCRFRHRLIIPIRDDQGRAIGFSGRVLDADQKGGKYINSPETSLFRKSRVLFGLDRAKRPILQSHTAVVCEGQLDLIRLHLDGIDNVIAPQGTALTTDHGRILKRYAEEVVLCFDSDGAGQQAAVRSFDGLLESGLAVRVAMVPAPHDPDSFVRELGIDAFRQLIDQAPGFFDFYLQHLSTVHDPSTDRGRLALTSAMAEALEKTGNTVLTDTYAQATAIKLGVEPDAVRAEFRRIRKAGSGTVPQRVIPLPREPERPAPVLHPPSPLETWLLKISLRCPDLLPVWREHLDLNWIQHPEVHHILSGLYRHEEEQPDITAYVGSLENAGARQLASANLTESHPIPNPSQQLLDILVRLRNDSVDRELSRIKASMAQVSEATDLLLLENRRRELREFRNSPLGTEVPTAGAIPLPAAPPPPPAPSWEPSPTPPPEASWGVETEGEPEVFDLPIDPEAVSWEDQEERPWPMEAEVQEDDGADYA